MSYRNDFHEAQGNKSALQFLLYLLLIFLSIALQSTKNRAQKVISLLSLPQKQLTHSPPQLMNKTTHTLPKLTNITTHNFSSLMVWRFGNPSLSFHRSLKSHFLKCYIIAGDKHFSKLDAVYCIQREFTRPQTTYSCFYAKGSSSFRSIPLSGNLLDPNFSIKA